LQHIYIPWKTEIYDPWEEKGVYVVIFFKGKPDLSDLSKNYNVPKSGFDDKKDIGKIIRKFVIGGKV